VTRAFVNNFYMIGYAGAGVDMGFEGVVDHRYATLDTEKVTRDTVAWLRANRDQRFALFVNYNSPHGPYEPPREALEAIPPAPRGPKDPIIRAYMAEVHKDDAALGQLLAALDELGIRDDTLVVVTGDHGETLSQEHDGVALRVDRDPPPGRFQHLRTIWDETVRVPIVMSWPKGLPANARVTQPVDTTAILPTMLELAGVPIPPVVSGQSMVGLIRGKSEPERPVIVEGRGPAPFGWASGAWWCVTRSRKPSAPGMECAPWRPSSIRSTATRGNVRKWALVIRRWWPGCASSWTRPPGGSRPRPSRLGPAGHPRRYASGSSAAAPCIE